MAKLSDCYPLRTARVHEVCGTAATAFGTIACAQVSGHLMWIREGWRTDDLNPRGLCRFFDPQRLLMVRARNPVEVLAVAEEALRDGSVTLVVLEVNRALDLREGRRLQLAAQSGNATGLCLIPEGTGSNATETRWLARPVPSEHFERPAMRWELLKNKQGTMGGWTVFWDMETQRLRERVGA